MTSYLVKYNRSPIGWVAVALGIFHLLSVGGVLSVSTMPVRITHLTAALVILFAASPMLAEGVKRSRLDRWTCYALAAVGLGCGLYVGSRWQEIAFSGGLTNTSDAVVGAILVCLVIEAARRRVGLALAIITTLFLAYPFVSPYLPGGLGGRGYGVERVATFLTATTDGVFGIPIGVSATYIVVFTIFGAFLGEFGASDFFFGLSNRLTRGTRAAAAKTAVIFSTLLGMVSGSAAGNVAVTGTITIPMMKREGYAAHQAGAIEAVVSTGGQIMPPIMGAAAFIMAELIGAPYTDIMAAAVLPALLFSVSIFMVVQFQACRLNLQPAAAEATEGAEEPIARVLFFGLPHILAFVALVALMIQGYSPFKASLAALGVLLVGHAIFKRPAPGLFLAQALNAIERGVMAVVPIAVACAAAGIISGVLAMTGLGSKISGLIVYASAGIPLVALILTMLTAIVLGMGLPTTAAYLILATVVAPALVAMGIPLLTAHMFVFFYGCISTITPPVALASYVAAGIAGADINKVSWTAFRYGLASYLLPIMFYFGPALLMQGTVVEIVTTTLSGVVSVVCLAAGTTGYLNRNLSGLERGLLIGSALLLLYQGLWTDAAGIGLLALVWSGLTNPRRAAPDPHNGSSLTSKVEHDEANS